MIWTYSFCLVAGAVLIAFSLDNDGNGLDGGGFDGDGSGGNLSCYSVLRFGRLVSVGSACVDC